MSDIFTTAVITTARLRLEPFALSHAAALNAINTEPEVMEFLSMGHPETLDDTHKKIMTVRTRWEQLGYSWWAVIERKSDKVIGAACVQHVANIPTAELEIGWRLTTAATGNGYATEAGKAAADYAFDVIGVEHVIAVANPANVASQRVMARVGMTLRGVETHYNEPCTTYVMHKSAREG